MSLPRGRCLGPYEIQSLLGAGGMGEVYRARDTRLSRDVALKVLSPDLATNPERLARFEREARAASALSHPAIVNVFDIGQSDGHWFMAMELVEGGALRSLLTDRPMPTRRLLEIAVPIAQGLARAHRSGIVHRDLKPENVMVGPDGVVKIVDFGIAKLLPTRENADDLTATMQHRTAPGAILGTVSYMSPEQATGRDVDAHSDQFSFGTMLAEMVTGRHPFLRETAAQTQAAVIEHEPPPVRTANPSVPLPLEWIVERCLAKDPAERYGSTDDLARDLVRVRDHLSDSGLHAAVVPMRRPRRGRASVFVALALASAAAGWLLRTVATAPVTETPASHLAMLLSGDLQHTSPFSSDSAVSPDGLSVVFSARSGLAAAQRSTGDTRLYHRLFDRPVAELLAAGQHPFWSPDGQWIGFTERGTLKKMRATGGPAVDIAPEYGAGASWSADDVIVFGDFTDRPVHGIRRVSASGGTVNAVTLLDRAQKQTNHLSPQVLPGGWLLYTVRTDAPSFHLAIQAVDNGVPKVLLDNAAFGRYIGDGLLLFQRGQVLLIARFDVESQTVGAAVPVVEDVASGSLSPQWSYAAGVLVYRSVDHGGRELVWVDGRGAEAPLGAPILEYSNPRLSPSGTLVAGQVVEGAGTDVVVFDTTSGRLQPVTTDHQSRVPMWAPDGASIVVQRRASLSDIFRWPVDGGSPVQLTHVGSAGGPSFESRAGDLVYSQIESGNNYDLWVIPGGDSATARPLVRTPELEAGARLHLSEHWIAYAATRSGRDEVWVASYPDGASTRRVATDGAREPIWSRDGRTLFYRLGSKMFAVSFQEGRPPVLGPPREMFDVQYYSAGGPGNTQYDAAPDGRFLMMKAQDDPRPYLMVLRQWRDKLLALAADAAK